MAVNATRFSNIKWALTYYRLGWSVVPLHSTNGGGCTCKLGVSCTSPGKHPRVGWTQLQNRRPTELEIHQWWKRWPDANIGVITGAVSGIIVLDVDGLKGRETLGNGKYHLPPTATAATGGGGWHYVYKHPGGNCRNFAGKTGETILPNVDFRGDGGLIVVAPSMHISGKRYEWLITPKDEPPAEAPQWLVKLIREQAQRGENGQGARLDPEDWSAELTEGNRNTELTKRAGSLLAKGKMGQEDAFPMLMAWNQEHCKPPLEEQEVKQIVESIANKERSKPSNENGKHLPAINAASGDLAALAYQAWSAVEGSNNPPYLFQRGGLLARVLLDDDRRPKMTVVSEAGLRGILARVAWWFRWTNQDERQDALPPLHVVKDMMAAPNIPLPTLLRIVEAPVFGQGGEIMLEPGYHPSSRTFYHSNGIEIEDVSNNPTPQEVDRAKTLITDELLGDFPFTGPTELSHAVALLLGPFVREMINGPTPLHMIEAPTPGTGKSLLVDVLSIPSTGRPAATMTEGRDEDEWRKRITASLLAAPTFLLIDNVRRKLDSAALSAALTSTSWQDRILGRSELTTLPVRTMWMATGNNPALTTEMARRTVRIRLDAKMSRPWQREGFRHKDLRGWAIKNRGQLIWAALTLVQAWVAEGAPPGDYVLGQYESWAQVVGGMLDRAGIKGFLGNLDEVYSAADEETAQWEAFITAWWNTHKDIPQGSRELFRIASDHDLLLMVRGDKSEHSQKTRMGIALSQMRDRQIGNFRIEQSGTSSRSGGAIYQLVWMGGDEDDMTNNAITTHADTQVAVTRDVEEADSDEPF